MSQLVAKRAMEQAALRFGVSYEEVRLEIEAAITAAMKAQDQSVRMQWEKIPRYGEMPTPDELIMYISALVRK